ncbi:MAG: amino acid ABC transporter permease [Leifsonia xyli]|nr:MAG: amino acid ABC transporter permease [Leifsonia xyli]
MRPTYVPDWSIITDHIPAFAAGLWLTLWLTLVVIALSMVIAVPVAFARMSRIEIIRWVAQGYIELFRCTPMLVQLFWIFYALPALTGIAIPGIPSAIIALTLNLTAFMAEAYRSGFQAVPIEQIEAAKVLQLTRFERTMHIILPQALRQQLPVILSLNISMFKDTALVSTIAVSDLMFVAQSIAAQNYRSLEPLTAAAVTYFLIAFPVSLITSRIERRLLESGTTSPRGRRRLRQLVPGARPV